MSCILGSHQTIRRAARLCVLLALLGVGCARCTYRYGVPNRTDARPALDSANPLTLGGDHPRLDRVERTVGYPAAKLRQWFARTSPLPDPQEQRRQALYTAQEYLMLNELTDVHLDVHEYDPATQWQRLKDNDRIHPFWKYTSGTVSHLTYSWFPGRVFHYDSYNPYTNTLTINSTQPSMALYEAAEAKNLRGQRYPGTYMAFCYLPVVPLFRDARVANDVLSYARTRQEWELEKALTPQIYSAFGADLVSQATSLVPAASYMPFYYKPILLMAGRGAGAASGQVVLKEREMQRKLISQLNGLQSQVFVR